MKIGIDARFYGPIGKGLGRYTEKLIKYLEKIDSENDYVVFLRKENFNHYKPDNFRFAKVIADYKWYTLSEQINMPKVIKKEKLDLMHFPHFNVPLFYKNNFIVTIHDLILLDFPTKRATTLGPAKYAVKNLAYKKVINSAVRRAKKVITVSNYTKERLIKHFGLPEDKIIVTYEACDGVESGQLGFPDRDVLKMHRINKPYLLYVGNAYPHKNLESLLKVFKKLRSGDFDYQLVFVGKKDYFYERLQQEAEKMGLIDSGDVIFYGFATEKELADLYRNASLYVFPSFIEGFGLPPLEAMSYGLSVVASKTSCLPEILNDAAEYFDPSSIHDIAKVILKVLGDGVLQEKMISLGLEQVRKYSWEKCARETLNVYKQTLI